MLQSDFFTPDPASPRERLSVPVGRRLAACLADGRHLARSDIAGFFAEASGDEAPGMRWSVADYNDAIEIGTILWLRDHGRIDLATGFPDAGARFEWLDAALPPRQVRSERQVALQQFSTLPILAWSMARAAHLTAADHVLEPSAGTGMLAVWPLIAGSSLALNEVDGARRTALATLFPDAGITPHDGELIDTFIAGSSPSVVLMNPPFARSLERGEDGRAAMRHLRSACRAASVGARIIAIMPEGFHAAKFAGADPDLSLLLNARIAGAFRKAGTGIAVRLLVFDKSPSDIEPVAAEIESQADLHGLLSHLPDRQARAPNVIRLADQKPIVVMRPRDARKPAAPFLRSVDAAPAFEVLEYRVFDHPAPASEQAGLYLSYRPSRIAIDGAPVHPTPLVESVAMGSVAAPVPCSRPLVPGGWRDRALLSEAQSEALVYAISAFARDLPGRYRASQEGTSLELTDDGARYRQGFFLGDGTGAGKGRQIAAVIMDRWLAGERRHIWISKNEALVEDARRDWQALGGLAVDVQPLSRWKLGAPLLCPEGILFVTYPTLRSGRAEDTRLGQLLAWAGEAFDGVIAFDEAHAMANALGGTTARGKVKGSEQGMAGLRLQNRLPRARVLYASATGASDIANLGYAARLGLWGPETAFPTHEAFMTDIRAGGVAAMELVARDLKAQGLYLARALSFAGVEYEILEHRLTEAQIAIYDAYAEGWAIIHRNLDEALEATRIIDEDSGDTLNRNAKAAALSIFEGTKQRFFAQLLLSMKLPSLLPAMEAALESGNSVVVQLVSTAESMLDRRLARSDRRRTRGARDRPFDARIRDRLSREQLSRSHDASVH